MAQAAPPGDNFHEFFESWLVQQKSHLEELVSAAASSSSGEGAADDHALRQEIERVVEHYEQYYRAKSRWAGEGNAVTMFKPSWRSSLEDAFIWSGGWRPSTAFHLLYSKSGLQFEAKLDEILRGVGDIEDLGDLSQSQIQMMDLLQRQTIREEKEIAEKLAKQQEAVADSSMVELSHAATEAMRASEAAADDGGRIEAALAGKEEGMEGVLLEADGLRLKTLKKVIGILKPRQAVHFLIAAAELHLRLHEWGKKRDAAHHHDGGGNSGGGSGHQQ